MYEVIPESTGTCKSHHVEEALSNSGTNSQISNVEDESSIWEVYKTLNLQKYAKIDLNLSFLITVVRVIKLRLIWQPSLSLTPSACVCEALSLPARSTKFCKLLFPHVIIDKVYSYSLGSEKNWTSEMRLGFSIFTRLATKDLTVFEFSRSVLSTVCIHNQRYSCVSFHRKTAMIIWTCINWKILSMNLTSLIIWCDLELVSLRAVSPTCLWATREPEMS